MSKLPLDLSKFKKVKADEKTSMLQHSDGHQLIIAHGKLSPKLKDQLDKLPMASGGKIQRFDDGGPVLPNGGMTDEQIAAQQPPALPLEIDAVNPNDPANQVPVETPQVQPPAPPDSTPTQPMGKQSDNTSAPLPPPPSKTFDDHKKEALQEYSVENKNYENDLNNGHIAPETYHDLFANKSTLGKIGSIFGMLVSGAGSGLAHQQNMALQMMDNEIQRDLEGQKQSKANAQNFLRLNQQNEMNKAQVKQMGVQNQLTDAQAKSTIADAQLKGQTHALTQMLQTSYADLVKNTNNMPEGPQKEAQKQALGMIYSKIGEKIANVNDQAAGASAYTKMLFGVPGGGQSDEQQFQKQMNGMRMLGPQGEARAKDLEDKHFPGLKGQASIPLNGADREAINSGIDFDQKLNRFMDWTKGHSGDLNPAERNAGQALAAELQGAYRQATHGGVYKEGEQNFISKLIDQEPTKFFNNIRVMPQLKAISGENQARVNQLVKSKGFEGYSGGQQPQQQQGASPKYKIVNGVKYMRGPNGEAVRVQ